MLRYGRERVVNWLEELDEDKLAYAAMQGQQRYSDCLAPRDTTYDPHEAVYEACVTAVKAYVAQQSMAREFARLSHEGGERG